MIQERSKVLIKVNNYEYNINTLMALCGKGISFMQIVKADAYGHGATQIAKAAIKLGCKYLGVANCYEGILLRKAGISCPILLLSPSLINEIDTIIEYNLTPSIGDDNNFCKHLNSKANKNFKVHININTGMGRAGLNYDDAINFINNFSYPNLSIEGVFSHFSASESNIEFTQKQIQKFDNVIKNLKVPVKWVHIANSGGVIASLNSQYANMVRLGIASFGIYTSKTQLTKVNLKVVMSFKSVISSIKTANKNSFIGYNQTYVAKNTIKYAIIPIGYADGYDYMLSNKGFVLVNNTICPVIGKISMDMITIDVSHLTNVKVGDEVKLIDDVNPKIKAENLAKLYGGNAYELVCKIGKRAKRYYSYKGKNYEIQPISSREFVASKYSNDKLNKVIEAALQQRMNASELSSILYSEVLKNLFMQNDKEVNYRSNFKHNIKFIDEKDKDYFLVETYISYIKKLVSNKFYVACANNPQQLKKHFLNPLIEYRWVLEDNFNLNTKFFKITNVSVNNIALNVENNNNSDVLMFKCEHESINKFIGQDVDYLIKTKTIYPKNSHQLSVYINEITKGVNVSFEFCSSLKNIEVCPFFAGKQKFPKVNKTSNMVSVNVNEWVYPLSGIVFAF